LNASGPLSLGLRGLAVHVILGPGNDQQHVLRNLRAAERRRGFAEEATILRVIGGGGKFRDALLLLGFIERDLRRAELARQGDRNIECRNADQQLMFIDGKRTSSDLDDRVSILLIADETRAFFEEAAADRGDRVFAVDAFEVAGIEKGLPLRSEVQGQTLCSAVRCG